MSASRYPMLCAQSCFLASRSGILIHLPSSMSRVSIAILSTICYLQQNTTYVISRSLVKKCILSQSKNRYCNPGISAHLFRLSSIIQPWDHQISRPCYLTHPTLNIWNWVQSKRSPCQQSLHCAQNSLMSTWPSLMLRQRTMISILKTTCNIQPKQHQMMIKKFILVYVITRTVIHTLTNLNTTCYLDINPLWNMSMLVIVTLPHLLQIGQHSTSAFYPT